MKPVVHRIVACANEGILNVHHAGAPPARRTRAWTLPSSTASCSTRRARSSWRRPTGTNLLDLGARRACRCSRPTSRTPTRSSRSRRGLRAGARSTSAATSCRTWRRWLAALANAGERVVPVRYLGRHRLADPAPRGRRPRVPRHHAVPGLGGQPALLAAGAGQHALVHGGGGAPHPPRAGGGGLPAQAVQAHVGALLRPLANELIDAFGARRELDLVAAYCHRYPLQVITRLLGIPAGDEEQLFAWVRGLFDYPVPPRRGTQGARRGGRLPAAPDPGRRARPREDLISRLAVCRGRGPAPERSRTS